VYSKKATQLDRSRQLRFIIHLVGDIHQPLHAAALFSDQFPNGDMGGNLYPIVLPDGATWTNELHAVWDGGAGQWIDDVTRPLNTTGKDWLDNFADTIMTSYPKTDPSIAPLIKEYNTSTWANESNAIASDFVYTAPQAPTVIPADYITKAQAICLRQIAIGGYRLADLLEYIFTSTEWGKETIAELEASKKLKKHHAGPEGVRAGHVHGHTKDAKAPHSSHHQEMDDGEERLTHAELERPALRALRQSRRA
jgi:hypothetical protein